MLGFQRLDVYRCSITFLTLSGPLASRAPRGHGELADQFRRAALSIPLNIAEGSGKVDRDAGRYYRTARASALECAAILDAFEALGVATEEELGKGREVLERVVAMLTRMVPR
ncbi:MAG: hypothetical protein PVS2B1_22760 [Candidatus Dormibacteraceae bacterium]